VLEASITLSRIMEEINLDFIEKKSLRIVKNEEKVTSRKWSKD